jgi:endonuclease/exonuclease/phosphatase family metal-dependent hydrolase
MQTAIQYHPALPTIDQATQNKSCIFSDHVPFISKFDTYSILSWNVCESGDCEGSAPLGARNHNESVDEYDARLKRIADAIVRMINEQKPDFVSLQEVCEKIGNDSDERAFLTDLLQNTLKDTPYRFPTDSEGKILMNGDTVTLYNSGKYKPTTIEFETTQTLLSKNPVRAFLRKGYGEKIIISNVHSDYSDVPLEHMKAINSLLDDTSDYGTTAIIGDFNCHCISSNPNNPNTTTSTACSRFREGQLQGAASIDNCFYWSKPDNRVCQASTFQISPETGKRYTSEQRRLPDANQIPEKQVEELSKFRLGMQYPKSGKHVLTDFINTTKTRVIPASNLLNQHKYAIVISDGQQAKDLIGKSIDVKKIDSRSGTPVNVLFVDTQRIEDIFPKSSFLNEHAQIFKEQTSSWLSLWFLRRN